ncbi:MAG: hypothetical protein K2N63_01965 [Lachnospiraceae bacterium]|nr:hypothetical protein [Lachnospiraceae bacterium]
MGSIIVLFVLWYVFVGRNQPKSYKKVKKNKSKLIPVIIILILLSIASSSFWIFWPLLIAFLIGALPIYIIYKILRAILPKKEAPDTPDYTSYTTRRERNNAMPRTSQLPDAVGKRIRIIEKFNKKYDLNLTENQIQTMVDASYVSTDWELFLHSMTQEYATVHQWFASGQNGWLCVYLRVFNTQTVSPDMQQQKQICLDSFRQVFQYTDLSAYNTPSWDIRDINNKFMTNFDDTSFMLAYRFLEKNGIHHELGSVKIMDADEELEALKRKYEDDGMMARP